MSSTGMASRTPHAVRMLTAGLLALAVLILLAASSGTAAAGPAEPPCHDAHYAAMIVVDQPTVMAAAYGSPRPDCGPEAARRQPGGGWLPGDGLRRSGVGAPGGSALSRSNRRVGRVRGLLAPDQVARYDALRGYAGTPGGATPDRPRTAPPT